MSELTAWVTGAGGLIGRWIVDLAPALAPAWRVIPITRERVDLTHFLAVERAFRHDSPSLVFHCAALSKTPACQENPGLARSINVAAARHLAALSLNSSFFFFSTDLVFDGQRGGYTEADPVSPLTVYGQTKAEAERIVLDNSRHTVIRTSLNGGSSPAGDRAFNEEMRRAWQNGKTLNLFVDEIRCPIPAKVTARAVWELALAGATGLFHLAGAEALSRFQIGQLLATRWPALNPSIVPGSLRDFRGLPRSPDTSLNCDKIRPLLTFPLPKFSEWLRDNPHEVF